MQAYSVSSHFAAKLTPNILFSQLLKSSEGPLLRRRRHLESSKSYIAAKLLSLPTTFTLGDMKNYNGFYNRPLNIDQEYLSFVMAVLQNNETDSTANYVRLTCAHQHACIMAFQRKRAIRKYSNLYPPGYVNQKLNICQTHSLIMSWCHVHAWQWHQRSASRPLFFLML